MFKFPEVHPHSHHDDDLNLIARDGHDHGHGNGHDDNVEQFGQNTSLDMILSTFLSFRIHRSPWSDVGGFGAEKVPPDGRCCRVLPFKVIILIFFHLLFEYFIAIQGGNFHFFLLQF